MSGGPAHVPRSVEAAARRNRSAARPASPRADDAALAERLGNRATSALLGGQPLPPPLRGEMEDSLRTDLGDVRVHSDDAAAAAAAGMRAKAFTVGTDIVFSAGRFDPRTHEGRWLLAHELAHVVQQSRGGPAPALDPGSGLEAGAHAAADAVTAGAPTVPVAGSASPGVSRMAEDDDDFVGPRRHESFGTPEFRKLREGFGGGATTTAAPSRVVPIGRTDPSENAGPVRLDLDAVPAPIAPRVVTKEQARTEADAGARAARRQAERAPDPLDRPGPDDQMGHTRAARHVAESGAADALVNDPATFMQLHSARDYYGPVRDPRLPTSPDVPPVDMGLRVVVVDPITGSVRTNTRHRAQEKLIDDAVRRARRGSRLTPEGQDAAGAEVQWRTEGTGFDSREVRRKRASGLFDEKAAIERRAQDPESPIARYRARKAAEHAASEAGVVEGPVEQPAPATSRPPTRGRRGGGGAAGGSGGGSAGDDGGVAAPGGPSRGGGPRGGGRPEGGGGSAAAGTRSGGGGDVDVAAAPARTASRPATGPARGEGLQVQTPRPGSDELAPTPRGLIDEATTPALRRSVQSLPRERPAQVARPAPVEEPVPAPQPARPAAPRPVAPVEASQAPGPRPIAPAPAAEPAPTPVRAPVAGPAHALGPAPAPRPAPAPAQPAPAATAPAPTQAPARPQPRPAGPTEQAAPGRTPGPTAMTDHTVHALGKATTVLGALNQYKSDRAQLIKGGKTPEEASATAGRDAAIMLGANLQGGRVATALHAYRSYDAAVQSGKSRTDAVHTAVADVGGQELAARAVKPSVAGLVVEGINTTAQLVGAPEEVQQATSGAVELVPSTIITRTGTAGIKSWDALAGAAKGDAKGVDRLAADWKTGGGGPWLQGYTQLVDIGVDVAGGTSFEKAVDRAAKAGQYDAQGNESWGSRAGGSLADAAYKLSMNDKALRGEYSPPVQSLAQGLRVASELAVGKSFGESLDAVSKASKGGPSYRAGQVIRKQAAQAAAGAEQVKASVVQKAVEVKTAAATAAADLAHGAGETATRVKDRVVETAHHYADEAAAAARIAADKARATKNTIASFIGW